jgi:hypothetical protein
MVNSRPLTKSECFLFFYKVGLDMFVVEKGPRKNQHQLSAAEVYGLNELDTALAAWRSLRDARRFGLKPSTGNPAQLMFSLKSY